VQGLTVWVRVTFGGEGSGAPWGKERVTRGGVYATSGRVQASESQRRKAGRHRSPGLCCAAPSAMNQAISRRVSSGGGAWEGPAV